MSNTSNFDYCVQLGFAAVEEIYHLALKNEEIFPHNLPPRSIDLGGIAAEVAISLFDDMDRPADLRFTGDKEITFTIPMDIVVEIPEAPDPSLSRINLAARLESPGLLANWPVDGEDQLGVDFSTILDNQINILDFSGLPVLSNERFRNAIHVKYTELASHQFSTGGNSVTIYNGAADPTLDPPNKPSLPEIETAIEAHDGKEYLKVTLPIHANVTNPISFASYGVAIFWREIVMGTGSVSITFGTQPALPALATQVQFDSSHPAAGPIATALGPLVNSTLAGFGTITEPWFTEIEARALIAQEAANYLRDLRFPLYTPRSGDPAFPLETPIGFLLVAENTLAILLNRRSGSAVDDTAPDNFRGNNLLALAVGRAMLDRVIADSISDEFPGVNNGGEKITTDEGTADLKELSVTPSDPGTHGEAEGHLWFEGEAEVEIDCWPDPDVTFDGAIFLRLDVTETETECSAEFVVEVGDFDAGQSCCDVFIDIIIPIVGWIMLGVIESMIDDVGGELAAEIAGEQARRMEPIPGVVIGVAEIQACLLSVETSSQGLVLPGKLRIRREGTSYEDLEETGNLPRP